MPSPLKTLKCPNCGSLLETDIEFGESLQCPSCEDAFTVRRGHVQHAPSGLYKLLIPIGYVLFLVVPVGGAVYFFATREQPKPEPQPQPVVVVQQPGGDDPRPKPKPQPRPKRKVPRQPGEPIVPGGEDDEPEVAVAPHPREASSGSSRPVAVVLPVAPEPHDAPPEILVAPSPRLIFWKGAGVAFTSNWEKCGAVDVRVSHVAVTHYPIHNPVADTTEQSKTPALVVVVEARVNDPKRDRALLSWTNLAVHYAAVFFDGGRELAPRAIPTGRRLHTGATFPMSLPREGTAVQDVLLFEVPPQGTRELELRLPGHRVQENGDIWLKIPASAWEKK
jgi:hypothetical protein